jgi:two-component system, sensor histidine kinase and response regulator
VGKGRFMAAKRDSVMNGFGLSDLVEGVAVEMVPFAEGQGLRLLADIYPDLPEALCGNIAVLQAVLRALIHHSLRLTRDGGITLRVRPPSHFAGHFAGLAEAPAEALHPFFRFEVSDTGDGYSADELAARLAQTEASPVALDAASPPASLSLGQCRALCQSAGGEMGADSVEGLGCCYWAELPLEVRDPAPLAPTVIISDARLVVAGFGQRWTEGLRSTFKVAGLGLALWAVEEDDPVELAGRLVSPGNQSVSEPVVVLLRAASGIDAAAELCTRLAEASHPKVILACPEKDANALAALKLPGVSSIITLPLRRQRLWQSIATAMGRA